MSTTEHVPDITVEHVAPKKLDVLPDGLGNPSQLLAHLGKVQPCTLSWADIGLIVNNKAATGSLLYVIPAIS